VNDEAPKAEKKMRTADQIVQAIRDLINAEEARQAARHDHRWTIIGINRPEGQTPQTHPRTIMNLAKDPVTYVLLRCVDCGWIAALELPGHWDDDQIKASYVRESHASANATAD
jgi:hypothetical protein